MPLSTLITIEMLKMQFTTWMINISRRLSFSITIEVVVTVVIMIVILEKLIVVVVVVVVKLIAVIVGVQTSILSPYHSCSNRHGLKFPSQRSLRRISRRLGLVSNYTRIMLYRKLKKFWKKITTNLKKSRQQYSCITCPKHIT